MKPLRVLDLFSGIGGFSLGLERTGGFETVAFCEIEPFPRKVLAKHWPGVPCYEDVRTLTAERLATDGIAGVDVITGGFPCQDVSTAGKRAGLVEGTRSGLYVEVIRLARELRPSFIVMENVAGLLSGPSEQRGGWFGRVLGDLAALGYNAEWENIPASALGAPHRRERVWIVAYPDQIDGVPRVRPGSILLHNPAFVPAEWNSPAGDAYEDCAREPWFVGGMPVPVLDRVPNGFPNGPHRVAALGNAVVPQIPELIGRAILASLETERLAA